MYKKIASAFCGCLLVCTTLFAQSNSDVLKQIEQNNKELQAFRGYIESQKLENKTINNLSNPEFIGYYLPFGSNNNPSNYSEFEISQTFEFPTVYGSRKKLNNLNAEELDYKYAQLKQNVILKANKLLVKIISLHKQREIEEHRHEKSKKVYEQVQELYNKEQVGILELNKAKIAWMQVRFHVEKVDLEYTSVLKELEILNGGQSVYFNQSNYEDDISIADFNTLWLEKQSADPEILAYKAAENTSLQQIKLEKQKTLPNLSLGYNSQGISSDRVSGFMGGFTIPLWKSKNKVKAAKSNYQFQVDNTNSEISKQEAAYFDIYNQYILLNKKYTDYKNSLAKLNSEELIYKAYELGEFSFMEYYLELEFFHNAVDEMLLMQLELQLLQAELYKHTL
jgi:outer membrane protein TolC